MTTSRLRLSLVCGAVMLVAFGLIYVVPARSYLSEGIGANGSFTPDKWPNTPVPIQISTNIASGAKISGNTPFATVVENSLAAWGQLPNFSDPIGTPTLSNLSAPQNGINLICFCSSGATFTSNDGTLGLTVTTFNGNRVLGANIFFNPQPSGVCWVTDSSVISCPNPSDAIQDLQTVAMHELGHFIGLDHSAVVRAVMFPFAPEKQTELSWDDAAGAAQLYPKSAPDVATGAISGRVSLGGAAVFGAHVFANSTTNANPFSSFATLRKTPIGYLTDPSGNYTIQGLPPDTYEVIAEPLDGPVQNSNVDWAGNWGIGSVEINFTTRWH